MRAETAILRLGHHDCLLELLPNESMRMDQLGRWQAVRLKGRLYRRVLDGSIVVYRDQTAPPRTIKRSEPIDRQVRLLAERCHKRIESGKLQLSGPHALTGKEALLSLLQKAARWIEQEAFGQATRFARAYRDPIEILPPDRYRDVVVLPAFGCPHHQCNFCAFYRGRPFQSQRLEPFQKHLEEVVALFGPALALRSGIFLGSASALSLTEKQLLPKMELVRKIIGEKPQGMAAFWDPDHAPRRTFSDWQALADAGLRAVYVGLESGAGALRKRLNKSGNIMQVKAALCSFREAVAQGAPLKLGLMVLVGVGGKRARLHHQEETLALLSALDLRREDIVYLSPLKGSLSRVELVRETERLKQHFRRALRAKISSYAMEEFRYFA